MEIGHHSVAPQYNLQLEFSGPEETDANSVHLGMRQKSLDMRIGLDIASTTIKYQVETFILVAGDSNNVLAAKLPRREGVEFLLDPLWQSVDRDTDLNEYVDGIVSAFPLLKQPGHDEATP